MSSRYDEAVAALYQAPHESFVTERQRLAAELKAGGDKAAAAKLAKLARPAISAWVVNQLWWRARPEFEELFESAAELRAGKLEARGAHRQALTKLSASARRLLGHAGHAASEGTMRRVEMTLSSLAAVGSFAPEPAGALTKDRDPPGFGAFGGAAFVADDSAAPENADESAPHTSHDHPKNSPKATQLHAEAKRREHAEAQRARDAAMAEKRRVAEERARRQAKRDELELAVRGAKKELLARERQREHFAKELAAAEQDVERAQSAVERAEAKITALASEVGDDE
ncbi:MAG TPA: hypothetical protein VK745_27715 [Polyangiaceae bacterium]|jgi:hypothetical protein|nr:hypothetical protein [Polyangiaceae bacterium]